MNISKKVIGLILGFITLVVAQKVITAAFGIMVLLLIKNPDTDRTLINIGQLIGLVPSIWLAMKVWRYFAKEKKSL